MLLPWEGKTKLPAAVDFTLKCKCSFKLVWNFEKTLSLNQAEWGISSFWTLRRRRRLNTCVKGEGKSYHLWECLDRECDSCGVDKLNLIKEDVSPQAPTVCWQKFEYVIHTNIKGFTQYVCSIQNYTVITLFTGILLPIYSFTSLSRNTTTLLLKCKKHHKTLFYFCCNSWLFNDWEPSWDSCNILAFFVMLSWVYLKNSERNSKTALL